MAGELKIDTRRKKILEILRRDGQVRVAQLSEALGATVVTIRSDLDALEQDGYLERTQGGAIQAMKEAGLKPGKDFLMVSVDGVPDMFRSLAAGEANASVELKSDIGGPIYDVVEAYLKGKTDWPKWVLIDSDLHTQADAAAELAKRGLK